MCDGSGFIANFWRAVKHQPAAVAEWADYPVSHIDLGARHGWLMAQRDRIGAEMQDPDWPGDAKVAGWCDWFGKIPHASSAGIGADALLTSCGRTAWAWLHRISDRLERVRVVHGDWSRCLNNHFGGDDTAVFLDPPYRSYEAVYGKAGAVADAVEAWARENEHLSFGD